MALPFQSADHDMVLVCIDHLIVYILHAYLLSLIDLKSSQINVRIWTKKVLKLVNDTCIFVICDVKLQPQVI